MGAFWRVTRESALPVPKDTVCSWCGARLGRTVSSLDVEIVWTAVIEFDVGPAPRDLPNGLSQC
jgi:hypothetical protein